MRIGIDYTAAVQQGGGIGRYTRELIKALAQIDRANRYILFSAGYDAEGTRWPANFSRRAIPLSDRHLSILWHRLRIPLPVQAFTGPLDLFHSPDFLLPPLFCTPSVLTVHDLSFLRHPDCFSTSLLAYLRRTVPRSVARANRILADSFSTRTDLIELMGVAQERISVIYPGVDERFTPLPKTDCVPILERYNIVTPYILSIGTLQPRKNYCRLIQAYHLLRQEHHIPHHLVIAGGQGWLYQPILDTIEELGETNAVHLLGFVPDRDLVALYASATVFAFPSLYEGFGIPVLEAMACGTPVVTSNRSSLPEAAGDAALLVSPKDTYALADALWRTLDDETLRNALREAGFQQAKRFTWQRSARALLEIYRQMAT